MWLSQCVFGIILTPPSKTKQEGTPKSDTMYIVYFFCLSLFITFSSSKYMVKMCPKQWAMPFLKLIYTLNLVFKWK